MFTMLNDVTGSQNVSKPNWKDLSYDLRQCTQRDVTIRINSVIQKVTIHLIFSSLHSQHIVTERTSAAYTAKMATSIDLDQYINSFIKAVDENVTREFCVLAVSTTILISVVYFIFDQVRSGKTSGPEQMAPSLGPFTSTSTKKTIPRVMEEERKSGSSGDYLIDSADREESTSPMPSPSPSPSPSPQPGTRRSSRLRNKRRQQRRKNAKGRKSPQKFRKSKK